jgi:hypothetical protein
MKPPAFSSLFVNLDLGCAFLDMQPFAEESWISSRNRSARLYEPVVDKLFQIDLLKLRR